MDFRLLITVFISLLTLYSTSLSAKDNFNLDFEEVEKKSPKRWHKFDEKNSYRLVIDSTNAVSGKNSIAIEHSGEKPWAGGWRYTIPAKYKGKKITLKGFIKTTDVADGWAGLWISVKPKISYNNMKSYGVTGTTEWKLYEVDATLGEEATSIDFGGWLVGKGKAWFDKFELLIDDKPIHEAPTRIPLKEALALSDNEFDNGSNLSLDMLNNVTPSELSTLGKIWGFLKYYHPAIAKGNYNWDYELFRFLPKYINSDTPKKRSNALIKWIENLGVIDLCTDCLKSKNNAVLKPALNWISNSQLSIDLQNRLHNVYLNRNQNKHFYIKESSGKVAFDNEDSYSNMPYPDAGFRLLALYRYWNMIQYYFPYKHITKRKWNQVLIQYIPQFLSAKNELNYELAIMGIIAELQDSHAKIVFGDDKIEKLKGNFYAPVHTRMIKNKLVVTDYYSKNLKEKEFFPKVSGLKVGDIITHINNIVVDELIEQRLYLYPGSNLPARLRSLTPDLLRSDKPSLVITLERNNNLMKTNLTLYKKEQLNIFHWYKKTEGKSYKMLKDNITYVSLNNVQPEDIPQIKRNIFNSKGVIVDIRKRPTNAAASSFAPLFFHEPRPFFKLTHPNIKNPGEFIFSDASMIKGSIDSYQGQVVVLSNEFTQSYGETMTMVFQARKNTKVIGSPTAGANGNVLFLMLPGNIKTLFSGLGVYYPDGKGTQQVGIVPDIHVTPTVKGITEGRDEVLEKAIEFIDAND